MNKSLFDPLGGIFVIFKKEFFSNLKSIRMIILIVFFTLIVLGTVYAGFSLMSLMESNPEIEVDLSEIILQQGPAFVLGMTAGIISVFGTLVPIILSSDTIVREKIENSLNLLLCRPISRRSIMIGKFLGMAGALAIPVLIVNTFAIIITSNISEKGIEFGQASGFILYTLIFLLIFVVIGQLISIFSKTTTTAFLLGIFIWFVFIFGILIIQYFVQDYSSQISLLNPGNSYNVCIQHALGTLEENSTEAIPLWGYYLNFILWLFIPLTLAVEIFNRKED